MSYQILDNRDVDQIYSSTSEKPQSGKAVAKPLGTKANIEFAPIDIGENVNVWDWRSEDGIYTLEYIDEAEEPNDVDAYTLVFDNSNIAFAVYATLTDFAKLGFVIGKDYKLTYTDVVNGKVERVIDLKDKVNITDFETALANKLTKPAPAADGSMIIPNIKGDGTEGSMKVRYYPDKYCIPAYSYEGNIKVNTPIVDLDAANKKYVDDALANVGGTWEQIVNITTTEEIGNFKFTIEEFPQIAKCKDFLMQMEIPKTSESIALGNFYYEAKTTKNTGILYYNSSVTTATTYINGITVRTTFMGDTFHSIGGKGGTASLTAAANTSIGMVSLGDIKYLTVHLATDKVFPIGTKCRIYGKVEG